MFEIEYISHQAPATVYFKNITEKADSFIWEPEQGIYSRDTHVLHKFIFSGRYPVNLTAFRGKKTKKMTKEVFISPPEKCLVHMVTNRGDMMIELFHETPKHRDNFIKLADEGFYEGLLFHRVIKGFMIQGGDPQSRNARPETRIGNGGPGYNIDAEINNELHHYKGALAAARQGDQVNPVRASSGSQFYIVHGDALSQSMIRSYSNQNGINYSEEAVNRYIEDGGTPYLDGLYTVFGQVIEGFEVVDKIAETPTLPGDRPADDIKILKVTVIQ